MPTPALQFYPPVSLQLQTHLHAPSVPIGLRVYFLHIPKHPLVGASAACRLLLPILQPSSGLPQGAGVLWWALEPGLHVMHCRDVQDPLPQRRKASEGGGG